jgi:hypothetical protein
MRRAFSVPTALLAALLWATTAFADATPVQLLLLYTPNVSNTDTPAASGVAELVMPEGEVRISAAGLPHLSGAERYVAWLVNSTTNQAYRLGSFNSIEGSEAVHYEDVLPDAIPNRQWNLLLVSIETSAEADRPSSKRSIAATFPRSEREPPPDQLPNTGGLDATAAVYRLPSAGQDQSDWLQSAGLAALTAVVAGAAGYALGKR